MGQPLDGVRVIDLGQIYAVPYCTLILGYLGADVIKIEPPATGEFLRLARVALGGAAQSFLMLNANKRSVTLNLKDQRGRDILLRLLERADVLVENYAPGVMEGFGLTYDSLAERFPRLIYASAKGYPKTSRLAGLGAMDATVQASSGFMSVTGFEEVGVKTPATFIDMGTGIHLVAGILAALIQRQSTGRGQRVDIAMLDVCIPALTSLIAPVLEGRKLKRWGNRHWGVCPSNVYPVLDGEVQIFCLTESHWRGFARAIGREDLLADLRYKSNATRMQIADEADRIVASWTRTRSREEVIESLSQKGVPCAPVRTIEEVVSDPDVRGRMLVGSEYPTRGAVVVTGSPIKMSDDPAPDVPRRRPPELGEHTAEVLAEIGIDSAGLDVLRKDGVV